MRFVPSVLLAALLGAASLARAQDEGALVVPPPPAEAPADAPPADAPPPASPAGTLGLDSPVAPPASSPLEDTLAPLLFAAETDLAAGRVTLAHARATVVARALPPGAPLRIRAEGLLIRVEPSLPVGVAAPSIDEVFSPLVAQAELDLRAGQPAFAAPRLDFALRALPPGPLRQRAEQLRASLGGAPAPTAPPYGYATAPPQRPARDPSLAGGGEWAELYITSSAFGAVTGAWLTHVASDGTASSSTYVVASVAGGGLMAVGVLGLHLSNALRTGVPPTISSSIRFGFANGALVVGLAALQGGIDDVGAFSLIWGGGAVGLATGLAVGLGLEPSVAEERFVESLGIWLGGLSTFAAMMTDYADPTAGLALSLVGLDAGILLGLGLVAAGQTLPRRRTMFLDLGFVAGGGAGAGLVLLGYYVDQFRGGADVWAFGIGAAAGAIAGWTLLWFLTEGMTDDPTPEPPPVRLGLGPIEGGGAVTLYGTL